VRESDPANSESELERKTFTFSTDLDHEFLNKTYQSDLEYAHDMFKIFHKVIAKEVTQLNLFYSEKEFGQLGKLAHKIKPTFSMVGLTKLSTLMGSIESSSNNQEDLNSYLNDFNEKIGASLELTRLEESRLESAIKNKL